MAPRYLQYTHPDAAVFGSTTENQPCLTPVTRSSVLTASLSIIGVSTEGPLWTLAGIKASTQKGFVLFTSVAETADVGVGWAMAEVSDGR
jgi:hypothetical protein